MPRWTDAARFMKLEEHVWGMVVDSCLNQASSSDLIEAASYDTNYSYV